MDALKGRGATSIKDYAKKRKVSLRTARKQLNRKVELGELLKARGPMNVFMYYEKPKLSKIKWHDPFNLVKRNEMARSVQEDSGEDTEIVEESGHISDPKEVASHATSSHDLASV